MRFNITSKLYWPTNTAGMLEYYTNSAVYTAYLYNVPHGSDVESPGRAVCADQHGKEALLEGPKGASLGVRGQCTMVRLTQHPPGLEKGCEGRGGGCGVDENHTLGPPGL